MIRILSLGAGVQSTTLFLLSLCGEVPKIDAAVFADTGWEPKAVYDHLAWLEEFGRQRGVVVHRVTAGDLRANALNARMRQVEYGGIEGGRWASLPLFTKNTDGTVGRIKRQCTKEYKLEPIRRGVTAILAERGIKKAAGCVEQWIGISRDEMRRMRMSDVQYITNRYPLVFDRPMTRNDCLSWLEANDFPLPRKSACIGCPFRSNKEWREIQRNPEEWLDAVAFDEAIRKTGGLDRPTYLHRDCVPLDQVDLSSAEQRGQGNWIEECTGMCGV